MTYETLRAQLHVNLDEEKVIWATDLASGVVISLRIPAGYGVTPTGEIISADGQVIARDGDLLVSGCRDYIQDAVTIKEGDVRPASGASS